MRNLIVAAAIATLLLAGCAKRPVFYPNEHYKAVGEATAQHESEECVALADDADLGSNEALEAGKKTAGGAAVGGATGAVAGAITGRPGTGAAVGAATGAMAGFFAWIFGSSDPDPVYVRYVDQCLADRGYQTIGWK